MSAQDRLARRYAEAHPAEVARILEELDTGALASALKRFSAEVAGKLVKEMTPPGAARAVGELDLEPARRILAGLPHHQASALLAHLTDERRAEITAALPEDTVRYLQELANFPPHSAGALMETRVVTIGLDRTVQQAISTLRKAPQEQIVYLYVTDGAGVLHGMVTIRDLLLAKPKQTVHELVQRDIVKIPPEMGADALADLIKERKLLALPVVDPDGRLLGVVRQAGQVTAIQEEVFEGLQRMVGAGADEQARSPWTTVVKKRLPWLIVNLGTAFLAAAVIGAFEGVIAQVTAFAILLPIIAGQGGNTGAQALAVILRGLALNEIPRGTVRGVIVKEVLAASVNGVAIAILTALAILLWDGRPLLAAVAAAAMVVNMVAAAMAGALLPMVLQKLGRDPAQSASIFLTTVTDVVGFAALLGLAVPFLNDLTAAG